MLIIIIENFNLAEINEDFLNFTMTFCFQKFSISLKKVIDQLKQSIIILSCWLCRNKVGNEFTEFDSYIWFIAIGFVMNHI